MKAWQVAELGEPAAVMRLVEVERPLVGALEVLVRVRASAANFPDALLCRGLYQVKPELPFTPGVELCGDIVELGEGVDGFQVGDRVIGCSILPDGGFAEYAVLDPAAMHLAPTMLDDAEAASLLIGYQTGWFALYHRAGLRAGDTLLVHAGAGGVGSAAIQLGKAVGAKVIAVVGGSDKARVAEEMGADVVIDRRIEDFVDVVKRETDERGVDVIFDPVGGETYRRSTKCIAFEGRIVVVGFAAGEIQTTALNHALIKNYTIIGLLWSTYNRAAPHLTHRCHEELTELATQGKIRPLVSERLPLADLSAGVQRLADGDSVGRVTFVA